jgi:threonine/homoserine/homoserine lactone efflux protein
MPDFAHWAAFLAAATVFVLIPGPSVLYVLAQGIHHGFRDARLACLGLAAGDMLQVVAAAAGLSVVLASSAPLFTVVKYAGAAYLVFLGVRRLRDRPLPAPARPAPVTVDELRRRGRAMLLQAVSVNALNPKTALFFLALLPQFVAPGAGPAWSQIMLFGAVFVTLGFASNLVYGRVGGAVSDLARRSRRFQAVTRYASGGSLIGLGVLAAVSAPPRQAAVH